MGPEPARDHHHRHVSGADVRSAFTRSLRLPVRRPPPHGDDPDLWGDFSSDAASAFPASAPLVRKLARQGYDVREPYVPCDCSLEVGTVATSFGPLGRDW